MALYLKYFKLQSILNQGIQNVQLMSIRNQSVLNHVFHKGFLGNRIVQCFDYQSNYVHMSVIHFKRRKTPEERKVTRIIEFSPKSKAEVIDVWRGITLVELAKIFEKDVQYAKDLFLNQIDNPNTPVNDIRILQGAIRRGGKRMRLIAKSTDVISEKMHKNLNPRPPPSKAELKPRPPVVTVMGHVDHGKTTLLDALRHSSVVEKEFGGITQHIGAFLVTLNSGAKITFLDTPGHAAFSSMRARGANLTDIVVLVVAADDGVMEQTVESIKMARNAKVPILVAINKIDSAKADIERTERMLLEIGIQVEKFGGDVQAVPISALKKQNLNQLTEALILQAELLEIGGDPTGPVEAVVVESNVHPHRGKLSTIVVQRGTLKKGDILVSGTVMAKVRSLRDADNKPLDQVTPGYPVEIDGWRELPSAGDLVLEAESEKVAREVIKFRESEMEKKKLDEELKAIQQKQESHEREYKERLQFKRQMGRYKMKKEGPRKPEFAEENGPPSLNIIIRADVDGTLEAILETLDTYESEDCKLDIVHYGVGAITQTDIELAKIFNGIIYAFNVELPRNVQQLVEESKVKVKHHNIIYKLIDDFKEEINSRMSVSTFDYLLSLVGDRIVKRDTNMKKSISPTERLVITLRYLATGMTFGDLEFDFHVSRKTIPLIVNETCEVIWQVLQPLEMPPPTKEIWMEKARDFEALTNFPNCLGAVDGKHIRIQCPPNSGSQCFNFKKFFSLILLAVCDAQYIFAAIDVGAYGREEDSTIFKDSNFYKRLKSGQLNMPEERPLLPSADGAEVGSSLPFVFLGDEAFGLARNVMRPYPQKNLTPQKRIYNYRHCRARRVVECSFGILSNKWRILHSCILVRFEFATAIVKSCCVLHNFVRKRDGFIFEDSLTCPMVSVNDQAVVGGRSSGLDVRDNFRDYFNGPGALPWQDKYA